VVGYFSRVSKKNSQIDSIGLKKAGKTTDIALSKVWVNGVPASQLEGFKSYVIPDNIQLTVNENVYAITIPDLQFKTLSLTIKVLEKKEQVLALQVFERLTVLGLKKVLAKRLRCSDLGQIFIQYRQDFLNNDNTLVGCGLANGAELTLTLSPENNNKIIRPEKTSADALEMFSKFKFVALDVPVPVAVQLASKATPQWKVIYPGLTLVAQCTYATCKTFQQLIHISKGMGSFEMTKECRVEKSCPECKQDFDKEIDNCGFLDCIYTIEGMLADGNLFLKQDQKAGKTHFVTFEEMKDGVSQVAEWKYITITTKPSS
jgi:hypothetical protein